MEESLPQPPLVPSQTYYPLIDEIIMKALLEDQRKIEESITSIEVKSGDIILFRYALFSLGMHTHNHYI